MREQNPDPRVAANRGMAAESDRELVLLDALRRSFAEFRKAHPRRSPFPTELRKGVLDALREGVAPSAVYGACKLTATQVANWQNAARSPGRPPRRVKETVRSFEVLDAPRL